MATSGAAALLVPWALPISCTGVLAPGPRCLLAQGADPWFLLGWTQAHVVTAPQAALLLAEAVGVTPAPLSAVVAREQPGAGRAEAILPGRCCRQTLEAAAAVAALQRIGAVAVTTALLPARPLQLWQHHRTLPGFGFLVAQARPAARCPRPKAVGIAPAAAVGERLAAPGGDVVEEAQLVAAAGPRHSGEMADVLRRLHAGRAAAQWAALLATQAVFVLLAPEGAGVKEPLRGRSGAGTRLLFCWGYAAEAALVGTALEPTGTR